VVSPLRGIIVADFSRVLAGPLATMTLADLGARVIKVERPGTGDDTRTWGPPFSDTGSTYFESVNRNKESICLDLADAADRALARELATRADVVIENFRQGTMDAAGLGYDAIRQLNPGVVYASITGFGAGAGADIPGYDFVVQALGGLMSITGEAGGVPMKVGVALVDVLTAKDVAIGVLAALRAREASGTGARLELTLLSSLQGALANQAQAWLGAGVTPGRLGNVHPSIAPYQTLNCADGELAIAVGNDAQFAKLCSALGASELASDARFATNPDRVGNRKELVALLEVRLAGGSALEWERRLAAVGVPAGRVATIAEGLELATSLGLEPTIEVTDAAGRVVGTQVRHPVRWSPPLDPRRDAPPALGQHDAALRRWLSRAPAPGATLKDDTAGRYRRTTPQDDTER
jgi:crotonobetainyl-CoA:carnitine CoA-transferase CaiB-like acyl-CoA transferase